MCFTSVKPYKVCVGGKKDFQVLFFSFSYPQRSSGHSLVRSTRVDTGRSCIHWSSHCTGRCCWKTSAATSLCRRGQSKGTGVHGGGCLQRWRCTALFLCWSHTRHPLPPTGMGSTGHSAAPGGWHTPGETGPVSGWHTAPSPGDPLSTCLMERKSIWGYLKCVRIKKHGRSRNSLHVGNCLTIHLFFLVSLRVVRAKVCSQG